MKRSIRRMVVPLFLLVAGVAALIYGTSVRSLPVLADVLVDKETIVLEPPPKEIWPGERIGPNGRPIMLPKPPPIPKKVKVKEAEEQTRTLGESDIIREVTVGGIACLPDGRMKLTYRPGEKGPALCPT